MQKLASTPLSANEALVFSPQALSRCARSAGPEATRRRGRFCARAAFGSPPHSSITSVHYGHTLQQVGDARQPATERSFD